MLPRVHLSFVFVRCADTQLLGVPSKHCLGSARAQAALTQGSQIWPQWVWHGMSSRLQLWELLSRQKEYGMEDRRELTERIPGRW